MVLHCGVGQIAQISKENRPKYIKATQVHTTTKQKDIYEKRNTKYVVSSDSFNSTLLLLLSASQPIVGLYSQPFSGLLATSFDVSRSHTTTRHIR